ncbi:hypothetical protein KP509_12G019100 [Ceratopteris richardii]|nr:hypothetical protein KP509_12G019100 [Ceratopteris richardii]
MIQEIGLKCSEHISTMAPVLLTLMRDDTPAVARHAISTGTTLFRSTFEQVALQGIYSGHVDEKLQESWGWVIAVKDAIYSASKEHRNDGVRLLAIKFIEMLILLFTPEPNGSSQPPPLNQKSGKSIFNVAWLHGGHPVLDVGSLGQEASRNLSLLLDQLRGTEVLRIPGPIAVVLVNSLSSIAKQRPSLYGRVLPVLLGLVPHWDAIKCVQGTSGIPQALKNAFVNLLKCTHSGAVPWRERVASALKQMKEGDTADTTNSQSKAEKIEKVDSIRQTEENCVIDEHPGKRARSTQFEARDGKLARNSEEPSDLLDAAVDADLLSLPNVLLTIISIVEQGEQNFNAVDSVVAKLSADMLADVVIENMKNLPHVPPEISPRANSDTNAELPFSFTMPFNEAGTLGLSFAASFSVSQPQRSSLCTPESTPARLEHRGDPRRDPRLMESSTLEDQSAEIQPEDSVVDLHVGLAESISHVSEDIFSKSSPDEQTSFIPGISETHVTKYTTASSNSSVSSGVMPSGIAPEVPRVQSLAISLSTSTRPASPLPNSTPPHSTSNQLDAGDTSEDKLPLPGIPGVPSTSVSISEVKSEVQVIGTSGFALQGVSVAVPVLSLDSDQQLKLWKMILLRILESHRQVESSGGNELRFTLLARFLLESDPGDEAWDILLRHVLADYQNHRGHELVLHTLYHLFANRQSHGREIDDGCIKQTAYDKFFLSVAEGLRDVMPPSDKSFSKLLGEAPVLPLAALQLLESLCNPTGKNKELLEGTVVERITQGLSAVWSLILLRPPVRSECLDIALKCTVHELEEVRTKAIRLVANKLFPLTYISQAIEDFARKMLHTVLEMGVCNNNGVLDSSVSGVSQLQDSQADQVTGIGLSSRASVSDQSASIDMIVEDEEQKSGKVMFSVREAQRYMSLYFALCTKNHVLLHEVFNIYERSSKAVKQAIHKHMPVLIRTVGASSDVLQIISDAPAGSKNLVLLVLHVLTELSAPSSELIAAVKQLYESKFKDAKLLIPILSSLSKEEVLPIFPRLVALPAQEFKGALDRILQGSVHTGPALTPAEVLIAIHGIDPERDHIPLSMVKDACAVCFQQRTVFTQQVLAKVLNQLVEQTPLPMLFMRTVIQAVGSFRSLMSFVMEILSRLVNRQIWKWPNLWIGFLKCAEQTQPHSFNVLLQLPALHLEKALTRHPKLRAPLMKHASMPSVCSKLPRSTLLVLELAQDVTPSEPVMSTQSLPGAEVSSASNLDTETQATESSKAM